MEADPKSEGQPKGRRRLSRSKSGRGTKDRHRSRSRGELMEEDDKGGDRMKRGGSSKGLKDRHRSRSRGELPGDDDEGGDDRRRSGSSNKGLKDRHRSRSRGELLEDDDKGGDRIRRSGSRKDPKDRHRSRSRGELMEEDDKGGDRMRRSGSRKDLKEHRRSKSRGELMEDDKGGDGHKRSSSARGRKDRHRSRSRDDKLEDDKHSGSSKGPKDRHRSTSRDDKSEDDKDSGNSKEEKDRHRSTSSDGDKSKDDKQEERKRRLKQREDEERQAKLRARSGSSRDVGASRNSMGSRSARSGRDEKAAYRQQRSSASTPGAHVERSASSKSLRKVSRHNSGNSLGISSSHGGSRGGRDEKARYRNNVRELTPGAQPAKNDRATRKTNRSGQSNALNGTATANSEPVNDDADIQVSPADGEVVTNEKGEAEIHAMVVEEVDEDARREKEEARMRAIIDEERTRMEEERQKERRKQRRNCRNLILLLVLAGVGVGAYFALRGGKSSEVFPDDTTDDVVVNTTNVTANPSELASNIPTDAPSSAPTKLVYDAPSDEDCQRLADGLPPLEEDSSFIRNFDFPLNIGLASSNTDPAAVIPELEEKIKAHMVPQIVGCPVVRRRLKMRDGHSRQLQNTKYMIADVEVRVIDDNEECIAINSPKCSVVRVNLIVKLRGDERNFRVVLLLAEHIVKDKNLSDDLKLSTLINSCVRTMAIQSNDPTTAPSYVPTGESSISPTPLLTVTASASPSMRPVLDPISEPTMTPTKVSTPLPTIVSFPGSTPSPTRVPATNSPTKSPTKYPTKSPTKKPTKAPLTKAPSPGIMTGDPTFSPSKTPSSVPTDEASMSPSMVPSKQASSAPSTSVPSKAPSWYPSESPSTTPSRNAKRIELESTLSEFAPFDAGTNKRKALDWLVEKDTWEPPEGTPEAVSQQRWKERFALVVFYYATGGEGETWANKEGWMTSAGVCSRWSGVVKCNADESILIFNRFAVNSVNNGNFGLTGDFPDEMRALSNLQTLRLQRNSYLTGPIPSFVTSFEHLTYLDLGGTGRTGEIPTSFSATNMKTFFLWGNELTGQIPAGVIGEWKGSLTRFRVSSNALTGEIPNVFADMTQLTQFEVWNNKLNGVIPPLPSGLNTCVIANENDDLNCFTNMDNAEGKCTVANFGDCTDPALLL